MMLEILEQPGNRPYPVQESEVSRPFWEGLDAGVFRTTECADCGRVTFPPKSVCPRCLSENIAWRQLTGAGVLYSYTRVHAVPPALRDQAPLDVAVVDLDEGVRLLTRLLAGEAASPRLDSRVQLVVTRYADGCLFAARPRDGGAK